MQRAERDGRLHVTAYTNIHWWMTWNNDHSLMKPGEELLRSISLKTQLHQMTTVYPPQSSLTWYCFFTDLKNLLDKACSLSNTKMSVILPSCLWYLPCTYQFKNESYQADCNEWIDRTKLILSTKDWRETGKRELNPSEHNSLSVHNPKGFDRMYLCGCVLIPSFLYGFCYRCSCKDHTNIVDANRILLRREESLRSFWMNLVLSSV